MIEKNVREQIIALMKREVVPAVGCTEPMAVALCVARATEALGAKPQKITALLSANILKNAMGVGIPGTGMIGLPIAIALGAIIGKSEYQLEVLKDVCPEAIEQGKRYIDEGHIDIQLKQGDCDKLYVEILCEGDGHTASAIISGSHTHFVKVTRDDKVLLDELAGRSNDVTCTITNGKVIPNGGKNVNGKPTDAIQYNIEFSDDPGSIYYVYGVRYAGF